MKGKTKINKENKNGGFTLIEAIIYLALFGLLMGGAVVAAYNIFESSNRNSAHVDAQIEGDFILAKISYALSSISSIDSPALGASNANLLVHNADNSFTNVYRSGTNIIMTDEGVTETLNNTNVKISNMLFDYKTVGSITSLTSSFTLTTLTEDGKTFSQKFQSIKYIR